MINDLADIQQAVADVVVAPDNFCDNRVCVLCRLYFDSFYLTPELLWLRFIFIMAAVVAAAEEVMMVDLLNVEAPDIQLAVDALALDVADNFCDTRV